MKADVQFEQQANSFLPVLKMESHCMMLELFRHGEDFDSVDEVVSCWARANKHKQVRGKVYATTIRYEGECTTVT